MGKNVHGGAGHKKFARKDTNAPRNNRLRVSLDDCELYAIVTKVQGGNTFHCHCIDNVLRLGRIRGKFSGRNRFDNRIQNGTWILVGLREWDANKVSSATAASNSNGKIKLQECDLLEVYSDSDKNNLRSSVQKNWLILDNNDVAKKTCDTATCAADDGGLIFETERDAERSKLVKEMNNAASEKIKMTDVGDADDDDEIIDFGDI